MSPRTSISSATRAIPISPSTPKEMPIAFIDESFPAYVIGNVGTVQNEMRLFYAPASQMTAGGKLTWSSPREAVRQPGPRHRVP